MNCSIGEGGRVSQAIPIDGDNKTQCQLCKRLAWLGAAECIKLMRILLRVERETNFVKLIWKFWWRTMRQCQIRLQFESRGMQFFKVLEKWFSMAKYLPIIVLWYSERGFYKIITWSPVLGVFTDALNHLAVYMPITGWVDVEKSIKVANIHSEFCVCYAN